MPQEFEDDAPAPAPTPAPAEPAQKPRGPQIGDVVDQQSAVGGEYEALGGGQFRRIG